MESPQSELLLRKKRNKKRIFCLIKQLSKIDIINLNFKAIYFFITQSESIDNIETPLSLIFNNNIDINKSVIKISVTQLK